MAKESNENTESTEQRRNHWNIQQKACVYKYEPCYFDFEDPGCCGCNGSDVKAKECGVVSISDHVVQSYRNLLHGETVSGYVLLSLSSSKAICGGKNELFNGNTNDSGF
jgi:hypothetical protein